MEAEDIKNEENAVAPQEEVKDVSYLTHLIHHRIFRPQKKSKLKRLKKKRKTKYTICLLHSVSTVQKTGQLAGFLHRARLTEGCLRRIIFIALA